MLVGDGKEPGRRRRNGLRGEVFSNEQTLRGEVKKIVVHLSHCEQRKQVATQAPIEEIKELLRQVPTFCQVERDAEEANQQKSNLSFLAAMPVFALLLHSLVGLASVP